jgi:DNA-directed RNA polymerase specialized sigma24 family protein
MSSTHPSLQSAIAIYAEALLREATRRASAKRRGFDADDIASDIAVRFLTTPEVIMAKYPDPCDYARACVHHACIGHDRSQRVQRCEGLRLVDNADGTKSTARRWLSGDATIPESGDPVFSLVEDTIGSFEDRLVERVDAARQFSRCAAGLPAAHVREIMAIDGHEYSVNEVAAACGQRRETVSRRVSKTRKDMRHNGAAGRHAKDTPA